MVISQIGIRGYKSFGNNEQVLKLNTDKGQLILLVGRNGNGKSALIESFEYILFGKVKSSKSRKWHKLATLPNRINGEMLNTISFQSAGIDVEVKRGLGPAKLELWENGVLNERAGKANIDAEIEKYVNMDIETFKSFISMSINDFKNFISLTAEEKRLLLDKLFNLEIINLLNNILKELVRNNKTRMTSLDSEIKTLNESITSINRSIERSVARQKVNTQGEIDKIKQDMSDKKDEYKILKEKTEKIRQKEDEIQTELDSEKKQYIILQGDIKSAKKDIELYDSGKCPTCATPFDSEHFLSLRESLVEKMQGYNKIKLELEQNVKKIQERKTKLRDISRNVDTSFNNITFFLRNCKQEIDKLEKKKSTETDTNDNVSEFKNTIDDLEEKKDISSESMGITQEKQLYYKELNSIFGEDGVKKSIIAGIIKPINVFIKENIQRMGLNFEVELDKTFTARIKTLGNVIDSDTLSTGETRRINIAILIAYLKLIRTKKHINILFLDEIFSSIDFQGIQDILILLRQFANDYNINIFVVHHAIMNNEYFDRIIKIEKNIFSSIEEMTEDEING